MQGTAQESVLVRVLQIAIESAGTHRRIDLVRGSERPVRKRDGGTPAFLRRRWFRNALTKIAEQHAEPVFLFALRDVVLRPFLGVLLLLRKGNRPRFRHGAIARYFALLDKLDREKGLVDT